ncbi:alpha/beta hydrolase-fold protein [Streptomyces albofaciens]|uniref:alpha/beta hydrolase-fold protein n=1 Tax=Streptomyces albofaciens TaxID=66866 RepID=UPI00142EE88C|nr:alpha/beta hydrolase-fold protein [Streptomyces albofaciens]
MKTSVGTSTGAAGGTLPGAAAGTATGTAGGTVPGAPSGVPTGTGKAGDVPAGPPRTSRPAPAETVDSPRIVALAASVAGGRDAAVREFWAEAEAQGTPLVEPIPWDPEHRAVTFLWRGTEDTRRVLLLVNRLVDRSHLAGSLMRRIHGTDVWHLTYRLRSDHRGSYAIAPDTGSGGGRRRAGAAPAATPASASTSAPAPTSATTTTYAPVSAPGPASTFASEDSPADDFQARLLPLLAVAGPDPLNPRTVPGRRQGTGSSVFELPDAPPQPWRPWEPAVRPAGSGGRGVVERHRPTSAALAARRDVWTYVPPGPLPDGGADTLVLLDGDMWFGRLGVQTLFDRLIRDGALPPLVVLAPDAVDNATRAREFGGRQAYVNFLAAELLPWAAARLPVTFDPSRTVVAGESLGGLTALYAGLAAPRRFGKVLAQSPSLWWRPEGPGPVGGADAADGPSWLAREYADRTKHADGGPHRLRAHLRVGRYEGDMRERSRELRDTLRGLGHSVAYTEYNGGHDYACWAGGLAEGLVDLLGRADDGTRDGGV